MSPSIQQVTVRNVRINRLAGLDPFQLTDLSDGINVIHGPNAAGKTRTAHVMQALIWPSMRPEHSEISGEIDYLGDKWFIACDVRGARYQRNGTPSNPPNLAGVAGEQSDRYLITLHDLLKSDNPTFIESIQRESAGGFDLRRARQAAGFPVDEPKVTSRKVRKGLQDAQEQTRVARDANHQLADREARLDELRAERDEAIVAQDRIRILEDALEYRDRFQELADTRVALSVFADALEKMKGDEADRLELIKDDISRLEQRLAEARLSRDRAHAELLTNGFGDQVPGETVIAELRFRLTALDALLAERKSAESEIAKQESVAGQRLSQISELLSEDQAASIDHATLDQLSSLTQQVTRATHRRSSILDLQQWLETTEPPKDLADLRLGVELLSERLRILGQNDSMERETDVRYALLLAAALLIVLSLVLAWYLTLAATVFVLISVVFIYVALRRREPATAERVREVERRYQQLSLPQPDDWTHKSLETLVHILSVRLAESELAARRADRWNRLEPDRVAIENDLETLQQKRALLRNQQGIDFSAEPESLKALADALLHWREARDRFAASSTEVKQISQNIQESLAEINTTLTEHQASPATDHFHAHALVQSLDDRIRSAKEAMRQVIQDSEVIDLQIQPDLEAANQELNALFTNLGLEPDDEGKLKELCHHHQPYIEACDRVRSCEAQAEVSRQRLTIDPLLEEADRVSIESELARVKETADRRDSLHKEIVTIEHDVGRAKQETRVEDALAEEALALQLMRGARETDYVDAAGWILGDFVDRRSKDANLPQVFVNAREYFSVFTAGEFRLEIDVRGAPTFMAIHTESNDERTMDAISSGTRVQLLLAVRLAFIETLEQGQRLPLILDETLGISDDVRANAIIDATIEICRKGRQIIYFTAQRDEVTKWEARVAANPAPLPCQVIDLQKARSGFEANRSSEFVIDQCGFETTLLPPETDHASARALLGVQPIDPWDVQLGGVDLWYLITSVPALLALRRIGVTTLGRYREMRDRGLENRVEDFTAVDEKVCQFANALQAALEAWRIGRSPRLTSQVLLESGFVSDAFRERMLELAEECSWDGASIIAALRNGAISRFSRSRCDDLEEYLVTRGFIVVTEKASTAVIRAQALLANPPERKGGLPDSDVDLLLRRVSQWHQ